MQYNTSHILESSTSKQNNYGKRIEIRRPKKVRDNSNKRVYKVGERQERTTQKIGRK